MAEERRLPKEAVMTKAESESKTKAAITELIEAGEV
jgi:hypothetical protein